MPKSQVSTSLGLSPYETIATTVFHAPVYNPVPKLHNSYNRKVCIRMYLLRLHKRTISVISSRNVWGVSTYE